MKNSNLLFILLLFSFSFFGQTKIDDFISVKIPGEIIKLDTIVEGIPLLNYYSKNDSEAYMVQKMKIDSRESAFNSLPYDLKSLRKTYQDFLRGQIKAMKKAGLEFKDSTEFKIDSYLAYKVKYNDLETGMQNAESNILLLNENTYVSTYLNRTNFDEVNKNNFLNSIKINNEKKPSQMIGNSTAFKSGYIIGKVSFYGLLIFGILFLIRKYRRE